MKFLGLDVGNRRVGVAFGDSEVRLATPGEVLTRGSFDDDARALAKWAREYGAAQLIVGLPRNMDDTRGAQAAAVMTYAERIGRALDLPVVFWDERLTTIEATQRAHETGGRGKKSRRGLDAVAAAVILQDYMDCQENKE